VILNRHVQEMTDLSIADRTRLMTVVFAVEQVVREVVKPQKINLASLGNVVPHMHWHVIPRFADDKHFPNPIWGAAKRDANIRMVDVADLRKKVIAALS
jgi:diadenosine tetraphosphate (Ap4A) HIT family hydrolase